jgi:hypothetical protein
VIFAGLPSGNVPSAQYNARVVDEALAAQIAHELQLAGLHRVSRDNSPAGGFGIQQLTEVLLVVWNPSAELSEAVFQQMTTGDIEHPAVLHSGAIEHAMAQAIATILRSAGMNVRISGDDLSPATVEVS